jgi:hypothetical protein
LRLTTLGGLSQLLTRLHISYKQGRDYVYSPDADYRAKLDLIEQARLRAYYAPEQYALLYLDEFSFFRQPTVARAYEARGHHQPLARRSYTVNTKSRLLAALDALSGQVYYCQRSHINLPTLTGFWHTLCEAYPEARTIYVVLDNWPVHFHPATLATLQTQQHIWPRYQPDNWPTAPRAPRDDLPIQLLALPTYASWLNPIEKLWRWLRQDILHLHRLSHDWQALKQAVNAFLDQFRSPSPALLRYVGLLPS